MESNERRDERRARAIDAAKSATCTIYDFAQAIAASDEAAGMVLVQGWQDIASAPRDGTHFLAAIGIYVRGVIQRETHFIWCNDETGEVHNA